MNPPFARTVCGCRDCQQSCKHPGYLDKDDVDRIAAHLGIDRYAMLDKLQPGRGAIVMNTSTRQVFRIPSIIPKTEHGRCTFQSADGKCSIHAVSPFGCAYFDTHMGLDEGQRRSAWSLRRTMNDQQYRADLDEIERRQETS